MEGGAPDAPPWWAWTWSGTVVVAERRRPRVLVDETEQLPADLVVVAAVLGVREHADHRRAIDDAPRVGVRRLPVLEQRDLLLVAEGGEAGLPGEVRGNQLTQLLEGAVHCRTLLLVPGGERSVDEAHHVRLARTRKVVGGDE